MKKNFISSDFYDSYLIKTPLFIFGNKYRDFIRCELGKIHPMFSSKTRFCCKKKIVNKELYSEVYVVDDDVLFESGFENFENESVQLENLSGKYYFGSKNKNRLFSSLIFLFIAAFSGGMFLFSCNRNRIASNNIYTDEKLLFENDCNNSNYDFCNEFDLLLNSIKEANGRIDQLNYNSNSFDVVVSGCDLKDLYLGINNFDCENFNESKLNNKKFTVGITSVTQESSGSDNKFSINFLNDESVSFEEIDLSECINFISFCKDNIFSCNGKVLSEDYDLSSISFCVLKENFMLLRSFFESLEFEKNDIEEFSIQCEKNEYICSLKACRKLKDGSGSYNVIVKYLDLIFFNAENILENQKVYEKHEPFNDRYIEIIGCIYDQGNKILFKRMQDGTIEGVYE